MIIGSTIFDTVEFTVVVVPLTVKSPVNTKLPPTFKLPVTPRPPFITKAPEVVFVEFVLLPSLVSKGTTNDVDVTETALPTYKDCVALAESKLDSVK